MVHPESSAAVVPAHSRVLALVESPAFVRIIAGLILFNALVLGLETTSHGAGQLGPVLFWADKICLVVFTLELALKFYACRLGFFRSGWNNFDLIIVGLSWLPLGGGFAILRAFRILRVLRLLSVVPQMRRVITALGHSLPGMTSVVGVLLLVFYVASVLATKLFGAHPDPNMQEWFGSVTASAFTLFQIMTLESWSMGVVRPTMELFPWAWAFFVPFIIVTSFAVLNLFIGIIVDAMQTAQKEPRADDKAEIKAFAEEEVAELHERFDHLTAELAQIKSALIEAKASAEPQPEAMVNSLERQTPAA
ncbi:MAG: ion transporter [Alphaproteobacteria bacterium]|nr:ion transporter [Alphaproteobacteria bacterium]